ncbi:hypothetical protein ABZP36_025925 [Zizania latifolia]
MSVTCSGTPRLTSSLPLPLSFALGALGHQHQPLAATGRQRKSSGSDASPHLAPAAARLFARVTCFLASRSVGAMAEKEESTSIPLSQAAEAVDPEDPAKSPPRPSSPTTSTRKVRI